LNDDVTSTDPETGVMTSRRDDVTLSVLAQLPEIYSSTTIRRRRAPALPLISNSIGTGSLYLGCELTGRLGMGLKPLLNFQPLPPVRFTY